ncbi:hypothetical protein KI387_040655, partial [Taxus chinensis]
MHLTFGEEREKQHWEENTALQANENRSISKTIAILLKAEPYEIQNTAHRDKQLTGKYPYLQDSRSSQQTQHTGRSKTLLCSTTALYSKLLHGGRHVVAAAATNGEKQ